MNLHPLNIRRRPWSGFTMVEFVGVIAIIAIIASFSLVSVQKTLVENRRAAEEASLKGLSQGLSNVVRFTFAVPSSSTWSSTVAAQLNRSLNEVVTNWAGNTRVVMVDPTFQVGNPSSPFSSLPYSQTIAGSREPKNLNFIILSSLAAPLPSLTGIAFSNVWSSTDTALPTGWPTTWKGEAADLKRERVTLTGLFYRLVLNNLDLTNNATWSLPGVGTNSMSPGTRKEVWVLDGSSVDLHAASGSVFARDIIHADASYIYMVGRWVQAVVPASVAVTDPSVGLVSTVDEFLDTPPSDPIPGTADSEVPPQTVTTGTCTGCKSEVTVVFTGCSTSVEVSSCKDLSNVVLEMCDGTRYKYDNLSDKKGTFTSPNGLNIVRVWVKSGCYQSGDGPGYGWRVEGPCNSGACGGGTITRNPASVIQDAFTFMRNFTSWSNNAGCAKSGDAVFYYQALMTARDQLRNSSNYCP